MEKKDFKKGINDLREIKLSPKEKMEIFGRIDNKIETLVFTSPVKSPWYKFVSNTHSPHWGFATSFVLILFVFSTGTFYQAGSSLPGDQLYTLKVDVIEPLKYSITTDPLARASLELENIKSRVLEVETLESVGQLSSSSEKDVENRLKKHIKSFNAIIATLDEDEDASSEDNVLVTQASFVTTMQETVPVQEEKIESSFSAKTAENNPVQNKKIDRSKSSKREDIKNLKRAVEEELNKYKMKHKLEDVDD